MDRYVKEHKDEIVEALKSDNITENHLDLFRDMIGDYFYDGRVLSEKNLARGLLATSHMKKASMPNIFAAAEDLTIEIPKPEGIALKKIRDNHKLKFLDEIIKGLEGSNKGEVDSYQFRYFVVECIGKSFLRENNPELYDVVNNHRAFTNISEATNDGESLSEREFIKSRGFSLLEPYIGNKMRFNEHRFINAKLVREYLRSITEEEVLNNAIANEVLIGEKRYGKGAKFTRVLSALASFEFIGSRHLNEFNLQERKDKLFLTTHLLAAPVSGFISDSCLSPGGENQHTMMNAASVYNVAWVLSEDLDWRCMVTIDYDSGLATIHGGYPENRSYNIRAIQNFLETKGYTIVAPQAFAYPDLSYWSYDGMFVNYNYQPRDENTEYINVNYIELDESDYLYEGSRTPIPAYETGGDFISMYEDDEDSYVYCDYCGHYSHSSGVTTERSGYTMCDVCFENKLEDSTSSVLKEVQENMIIEFLSSVENLQEGDIKQFAVCAADYVLENGMEIMNGWLFRTNVQLSETKHITQCLIESINNTIKQQGGYSEFGPDQDFYVEDYFTEDIDSELLETLNDELNSIYEDSNPIDVWENVSSIIYDTVQYVLD